jgi:peptidoglycan/xylan/chitin deacetylase (PgdA/CDA1 family)
LPPTICLTLDLEPDFSGRLEPTYLSWDPEKLEGLLELLRRFGARLTVFVVGQSLAARPDVIRRLEEAGAEFHLHSHSHDLAQPDALEEIRQGTLAFEAALGVRPRGYRAPEGRISQAGWKRLSDEGFLFDSSVFPSVWPSPRYLAYRPRPFRPQGLPLWELPISTLTPLRFIVSLSWMKLLGWGLYEVLLERAAWPDPLVFDMHLHDLVPTEAFSRLGPVWRFIYRRNRDQGRAILERFLKLAEQRGARFRTLGEVAADLLRSPEVEARAALSHEP